MRVSISADEVTGVAGAVAAAVEARGHEVVARHGALEPSERDDWAWASEAAARDVADGRAEQAVVCCWTGTGASARLRVDVSSSRSQPQPRARSSAARISAVATPRRRWSLCTGWRSPPA